ncbi:EAL domain-containing protein [Acuticoccus sp. MNP-M23]|uniref:putative bifunctional diguanylate cyclase/phosphodiesterase n=1 Tax=Acuticoccus sp. MNP-M23 TaxID=3072793 RepID=UPI002816047B|nr:EAL domain-containing protein [Acuticoccus sp. MNP-M23]WMS42805.1 EAL domain-containing protein [Acuticoccus sp. MNP-M23]
MKSQPTLSNDRPIILSSLSNYFFQILFCLIVCVTVIAAASVSLRMIQSLLEQDATSKAKIFSEALLQNTDVNLASMLGEEPISETDLAYLHAISGIETILQFKIYDLDGNLRFTSGNLVDHESSSLKSSDADLLDRLRNGEPVTESVYGSTLPGYPMWYAKIHLPVTLGGKQPGLVSIYIDITHERSGLLYLWRWLAALFAIGGVLTMAHSLTTANLYRKRRKADAEALRLARFDTLTGVANRGVFNDALHERLATVTEKPRQIALHLIDLDGFKTVNDLMGHEAADHLLHRVADVVASKTRCTDLVARLGGDEFGVIQMGVTSPDDASAFANRLVQTIREMHQAEDLPVDVTASLGTAIAPDDAIDAVTLHRFAEAALYRSKQSGRDRSVLYEQGMDETVRHRNTLRLLVRQALENDEFEIYFQPVHRLSDGSLVSFEALLRMREGTGNFISPAEFIPVAEELGVMDRLGTLALNRACEAAASWSVPLSIAVNLSAQQFSSDVVATVKTALAASNLPADRLMLEITESLFIADTKPVEAQLADLHALGCAIALDDFGTGYTSLSYLWTFSFDALKVDRSCFNLLGKVKNVDKVLQTIATMCTLMELSAVAEGIETDAQLQFAREAGYTHGQGFLFGRPMPSADVHAYIAANACEPAQSVRKLPHTPA